MHRGYDERHWPGWPGILAPGYARAFGEEAADLNLDFTRRSRPELVSELLAGCLRPHAGAWLGDEVWDWTLAQRLQGLLALALASQLPPLVLVQRCGACGEPLEIAVEPGLFERDERVVEFQWSPTPEQPLTVRLPTGREQLAWCQAGEATARAMAGVLVRPPAADADWQLPEEWLDGIAEQLAQHDPLTALELDTVCPACGAAASIELDLEAELLTQLHASQRRTLHEIHSLASAYHWSEAEILALPTWRRRYYLSRLAARGMT